MNPVAALPSADRLQPGDSRAPTSRGPEPFLRTLVPALRRLQGNLQRWLDAPHPAQLGALTQAALEGLACDLARQAEALDVDRPLLVIMFMGGTGVGKSTLLNALAGGSIAQASFARPTTRDPVVYFHDSIKAERLDTALRHCRLAAHDRPSLEQKILVDTPDLDSNDLVNREKLKQLLPVADVVLYVGSQEKYHDKLGWDLFLEHRRRRAFAFVLNKWDRCVRAGVGLRPDEDLVNDLRAEGFQEPLLFRTSAQFWVNHVDNDGPALDGDPVGQADESGAKQELPAGEQFEELVQWLERGLTRLEVEAIKARGVSQLLHQLSQTVQEACPPDLTEVAERTRAAWTRLLGDEAEATAEILLNTLEPYQREIEQHFAIQSQRQFRGLMASYLHWFTRAKYVGSSLRDRLPFLPRSGQAGETPASWDLAAFTREWSSAAGEQHLDARGKALANRLLVAADAEKFPLPLLTEPTEKEAKLDWRQRHAHTLIEVLQDVEQQWAKPTGARRWLQKGVVWLGNHLPLASLFAICVLLLWQYTVQGKSFALSDILLPLIVVFIILVLLHILIVSVLPLRWPAMRGEFDRHLRRRLQVELQNAYGPIPAEVAAALQQERRQIEQLDKETREIAAWLEQREQAAHIEGLYGK
jgi:hypothetical protein